MQNLSRRSDTAESTARRYARVIEPNGGDSLSMLVRWIRPRTTILDVGTAGGALGLYLSMQLSCVVDGVERDIGAAMLSRRSYRRMVVADLERSDLASLFPARTYDYVFCADVLEHLPDPLRVLAGARRLLREDGHLLISIPNFAYAPLLAELLAGRLQYRPVGLLDQGHLRFVTRRSLEQMLQEAGLAPVALDRVTKPAHESEFDPRYLEMLPPAVRQFLDQADEAYTYQFLVDAIDGERHPSVPALPPQRASNPLRFVSRLYWRPEGIPYQEERRIETLGTIGGGLQTLRFTLPQGTGRIGGLLLELTDREAILELKSLRVDGPGGTVWSWNGTAEEICQAPCERMTLVDLEAPGPGIKAVIWAQEPRLELPIGKAELESCERHCTVEVEMVWPQSPEYIQVLDRLQGRFTELTAAQEQLAELILERDRLGGLLEERLQLLQERETAWREAVQERDRALALLEERLTLLQTLTRQVEELEAERAAAQQQQHALIAERDRLGALLEERLRLLQETETAWREAVEERDRALVLLEERLVLLQALVRQVEELESEHELLRRTVESYQGPHVGKPA